jgi:O-antigen/teichoic acid export membrane protein
MSQSRTFKTAVLGSGKFLAVLTTLITFAVLSRLFTKADYAAYRQTLLAFTFLSPLLTLGLPKALYYFLPLSPKNGRSILSGNLLLLFFMGCIFAIVVWCGGAEFLAERFNNSKLARLLLIYSPYALLALPVTAISACLVACNKVTLLTIFNVSSKFLFFPFVIGFVLIWRTPAAAISGTVLTAFLIFIPALFIMFGATTGETWKPTRNNMWEQLKYSVPLGLAGMFGIISMNLDKALVSFMCPPEVFAVYANGAIEIPMIGIVTGSVMAILIPEFAGMYQCKDITSIVKLWHSAMIKCSLVILPIMIYLYVMAPEFIKLIFSKEYVDSVYPFRVYLLALPVRITQFGAIFMAAGKNQLILYRAMIGLTLNLFLSIVFISLWGSIGAAISTVLIIYLWGVPYNIMLISKILEIRKINVMPHEILLKIFFIVAGCGIVFLLNPLLDPLGDMLKLCISGILYGGLVLVLFNYFHLVNVKQILSDFKRKLL